MKLFYEEVRDGDDLTELDTRFISMVFDILTKEKEKKTPKTLKDVLGEICKDNDQQHATVKKLQLSRPSSFSNDQFTYYIAASDGVNTRHQGYSRKMPKLVHMKFQEGGRADATVHVFMTASGTGKTIELAGSAYTRQADLAIVWVLSEEDVKDVEKQKYDKDRRNELAVGVLRQLAEKDASRLVPMVQEYTLKEIPRIVYAFDEASVCPLFVRALIANPSECCNAIIATYKKHGFDIDVVFSVAGTGVSRGSIGSNIENMKVFTKTNAMENPKAVYESLCSEFPAIKLKYDEICNQQPVLHVLMEHNARMMSIAIDCLSKDPNLDRGRDVNDIVMQTIDRFMESNGMWQLAFSKEDGCSERREKMKQQVLLGCQVLAEHLFGQSVQISADKQECENMALTLDYGLKFDTDNLPFKEKWMLVQKYGLLVPTAFPDGGGKLDKPFTLDPAMQLVVLYLLQPPRPRDNSSLMLAASSYGFEVLSTHILKAALAASLAVPFDDRPTVGEILQKTLGFFTQDEWGVPDEVTSIMKEFNELRVINVVDYGDHDEVGSDDDDHGGALTTFLQRSEARIVQREVLDDNDDNDNLTWQSYGRDGILQTVEPTGNKDYLAIDKHLLGLLMTMRQQTYNTDSQHKTSTRKPNALWPPIASIVYRDSELPDGSVTFVAEGKSGTREMRSVLLQAKDYFRTSKLHNEQLQKHAAKAADKTLWVAFGRNPLLCVASRGQKLEVGKSLKYKRCFYGFPVDKSAILKGVLDKLDRQRESRGFRIFSVMAQLVEAQSKEES